LFACTALYTRQSDSLGSSSSYCLKSLYCNRKVSSATDKRPWSGRCSFSCQ